MSMAGLLGISLAVVLTIGRGSIPGMFSRDPQVSGLVTALLPLVIVSQPINALAFVWDGVLFGAGGFRCVVKGVRARYPEECQVVSTLVFMWGCLLRGTGGIGSKQSLQQVNSPCNKLKVRKRGRGTVHSFA